MRSLQCRAELRLVERRYEERVVGAFDRTDFSGFVGRCDDHSVARGEVLNGGRQSVVARGLLDRRSRFVQLGESGILREVEGDLFVVE